MAEIPDVVPNETIEVEWGNAIRDRTVQRYDDATTLASEHPNPTAGDLAYMQDSGDVLVYHSGAWQPFLPTGAVVPFAGANAPTGWLFCHGQAVSRTTYARLFAIIGTTYGAGDGSTTFNLPDLRQRFILGKAASGTGSALGATGGQINHTHSGPSHSHSMSHTHTVNPPNTATSSAGSHTHSNGTTGSAGSHRHTLLLNGTSGAHFHATGDTPGVNLNSRHDAQPANRMSTDGAHTHAIPNTNSGGSHTHNVDIAAFTSGGSSASNTGSAGTGQTGSNNPPFLVLNHIIKT